MTRRRHPGGDARRLEQTNRRAAYACDITYGTNSEFGFDYLRDNMAVELDADGAARPLVRDRGRGRLDPDRRGAHAAHHLGPARAGRRHLLHVRQASSPTSSVGDRLRGRREVPAPPRRPRRACTKVERALGVENLYAPENGQLVNHLIQALKAKELYKRDDEYVVHGRRGQDRRRVHRPHHGGPALVGGPAPGRRGQGGRADPGGERHRRHHHDPELLPHVREARRHDRHRAHRGERVPRDLRPRGRADPDQPADGARRQERLNLQDQGREVRGRRRGHRRAPRDRPAGAGRHDLGRGLRAPLAPARAPRHRRTRC